jgi:hypothetical protein
MQTRPVLPLARFPNQSANRRVSHGCGGLGTFSFIVPSKSVARLRHTSYIVDPGVSHGCGVLNPSSYWSVARLWHTHLVLLECRTSVAHSPRLIGVLHVCGTLTSFYRSVARLWHTHIVLLECCTSVAHSSRSLEHSLISSHWRIGPSCTLGALAHLVSLEHRLITHSWSIGSSRSIEYYTHPLSSPQPVVQWQPRPT